MTTNVQALERRIAELEARLAKYEGKVDVLTPPPEHYIVDEPHGRAKAFYKTQGLCSTVSRMDALKYCWIHYLDLDDGYDQGDFLWSMNWRKTKDGWKFWHLKKMSNTDEWIASDDFDTMRNCLLDVLPVRLANQQIR